MSTKNEPKELRLIVSDDEKPIGKDQESRYEVVSVSLVDPTLKQPSRIGGARLCGGTSTCVAVVGVGDESA